MAIDAIGIPTVGRPAALARCLASYVDNAVRHGRTPRVIVCDDGRAPQEQDASRDVVGAARAPSGTIRYVGIEEKRAVVRALAQTGEVPPAVLRFAFFGVEDENLRTLGANRNMLALYTAGQCSVMVDDDTVCETYRPHGYDPRPVVRRAEGRGVHDPAETWPLRPADDEGAVGDPVPLDCLAEHELWLGRSGADDDKGPPPRAGLDAAMSPPRVAITIAGLIGDCAWGSPSQYLFLRGSSLARLTASDESYDAYVTSRHIMHGVRRPTVGDRADEFVSTCFAVDHRTTLPPFPPVCRGSDRVFAALVARCCPQALFAHVPLMLAHRPATVRAFWRGEIGRSAAGLDGSTLLCALIEQGQPPSGRTAEERLASCGERLEAIGALDDQRFTEEMTATLHEIVRARIERLEVAIVAVGEREGRRCAHFERDARAYIAALGRTRERQGACLPLDLCGGRSDRAAVALTRDVICRFGGLLRHWTAIARIGRELTAAA